MTPNKNQTAPQNQSKKPRRIRIIITAAALAPLAILAAILAYNNISLTTDKTFEKKLNTALENALQWTEANKQSILNKKNIALVKLLNECNQAKNNPLFSQILADYLNTPARPKCWKRLLDPDYHVDRVELNITIKEEYLDNKWVLYALAPDKADADPKKLGLFDPNRWQRRKLTHQLDALLLLRKTRPDPNLDLLIDRLCQRITTQLITDFAVIDLYIQKVAFVLRAKHPEKIRKRWLERIIENQLPDGGWNDRWFCFTSQTRKPLFDLKNPPSNEHATIQAMTALYLVRHKCPKHFRLNSKTLTQTTRPDSPPPTTKNEARQH